MSKLKELEKRLEKEPDNLGLRVMVAGALREAGKHPEAVELYRSVAEAYRDQGRTQQAIAVCRSILEIAPDDTRCHALLASLVAHHKGRAARDTAQAYGDEIVLEVGTPPPPETNVREPAAVPSLPQIRPPTVPPTSPAGSVATRLAPKMATGSNATASPGAKVPFPSRDPSRDTPKRRSSIPGGDETPLPAALPYHVADPTTRSLKKLSDVDLIPTPDPDPDDLPVAENAPTRPGSEDGTHPNMKGIASAARRISQQLINPQDLSAELDTRQRPRIESGELAKIIEPPPTVPVERLDAGDDDDEDTNTPGITLDMRARSNPPPPDTEDDDGVPTLSDEDNDEPTRPRDTPLDVILRTEAEGPFGTAFFQPLPVEHREAVLTRFRRKSVKKGTTVIRQGEVGHSLVVVLRGQLEARVDRPKGSSIDLGAIATGEYVGEGSLLARTPSPVHVTASLDCDLLVLAPRDFYEIAGAFPALWAELKDVAERRKRELEMQLKK